MNYELQNVLVDYVNETKSQCSFKLRDIDNGKYVIELYTSRPDLFIGKAGETIHKYSKMLKSKDKYFEGFEINEVDGFISLFTPKISKDDWMKAIDDYYMSLGM